MLYTPTFIEIRNTLKPLILEHIKRFYIVKSIKIHKHIYEIKKKDKTDIFQLITFTYGGYPYSAQVEKVLTDLVRRFIIKQTDEGYKLTSYGKELVKKIENSELNITHNI
jgi:predicted transcriptional regulator